MDDSGTFNTANEWLTRDLDSTPGTTTDNYSLVHDAVGNMTDDGKDYKYVYDAFGRLITVKDQTAATVAEYRYNGLGYRISWHYDADADKIVDGSDPTYYFAYDDRWRVVATYRGSDSDPKERFTFHNAGANGYGGSSYIDLVVLRDRDANTAWTSAGDGTLEERNYYAQNWRADVSVITGTDATPIEWIKYSAYGEASSFALADYDMDGDIDSSDQTAWFAAVGGGNGNTDLDFDGDLATSADDDAFFASYGAASTGGGGALSRGKTANRIGYAGYQWDSPAQAYHVRHRVYRPDMGRWTKRDPLGYVDGVNLIRYVSCNPQNNTDPFGLVYYACNGGGSPVLWLPDATACDCCEIICAGASGAGKTGCCNELPIACICPGNKWSVPPGSGPNAPAIPGGGTYRGLAPPFGTGFMNCVAKQEGCLELYFETTDACKGAQRRRRTRNATWTNWQTDQSSMQCNSEQDKMPVRGRGMYGCHQLRHQQ